MKDKIDNLARLLFERLPSDAREAGDSLRQNFADILSAKFDDWGLASAEDLAKAQAQLKKCQERLAEIERRLGNLEAGKGPNAPDDSGA